MADKFGRPSWDDYFMSIAMLVTTRSLDSNTRHATLIVDDQHRIISLGYNGPPRNAIDENVPRKAPDKRPWFIHSELNAIFNAKISLENTTAYITGRPCGECFRSLIQVGVKRVVYGPIKSSPFTEDETKIVEEMLIGQDIEFIEYKGNFWEVFEMMEDYLATKNIVHPRLYENKR